MAYDRRGMSKTLPYQIAVLCYLFDQKGRVLLLNRSRRPNQGLYSPIGGKLHMHEGESPAVCAKREISEEAQINIDIKDLHLTGIISETSYENTTHWLMFLYELTRPAQIARMHIDEGELGWHELDDVERLPIPKTDREVIWPLFRRFRGRFFAAHIDCTDDRLDWRLEHPALG